MTRGTTKRRRRQGLERAVAVPRRTPPRRCACGHRVSGRRSLGASAPSPAIHRGAQRSPYSSCPRRQDPGSPARAVGVGASGAAPRGAARRQRARSQAPGRPHRCGAAHQWCLAAAPEATTPANLAEAPSPRRISGRGVRAPSCSRTRCAHHLRGAPPPPASTRAPPAPHGGVACSHSRGEPARGRDSRGRGRHCRVR